MRKADREVKQVMHEQRMSVAAVSAAGAETSVMAEADVDAMVRSSPPVLQPDPDPEPVAQAVVRPAAKTGPRGRRADHSLVPAWIELASKTLKALRALAEAKGVDERTIEHARDDDEPKNALIALILQQPEPEPEPEPQSEPEPEPKGRKSSKKKEEKKKKKAEEAVERRTAAEKKAAVELEKMLAAEEEAKVLEQASNSFDSSLKDLPDGWEEAVSRSSGEVYYRNSLTGESSYDFPTLAAAAADDSGASSAAAQGDMYDNTGSSILTLVATEPGSLGLSLGSDHDGRTIVSKGKGAMASVPPFSVLVRVDDVDVEWKDQSEVVSILKASGRPVSLGFRPLPAEDAAVASAAAAGAAAAEPAKLGKSELPAQLSSVAEVDETLLSEPSQPLSPAEASAVAAAANAADSIETLNGELKVYLASGKEKHARWFWLTPQLGTRKILLHWGKKLNGKGSKTAMLLHVLDKPTMRDPDQLFRDMDDDNSGSLDETEVSILYKKARGEKLSKANLSAAMCEMDGDGSGDVSIDEFRKWWAANGGDLEQHRSEAMTFVCAGGVEVLVVAPDLATKQRWVAGCGRLLPPIESVDDAVVSLSGSLALYLTSGQKKHSRFFWMNAQDRQISWGKELRSKVCKTETLIRVINAPIKPDARELFRQIDADNSGFLDKTEVSTLYLKARGEKLSGRKLKDAMKVMDGDGNNHVSLLEFEAWWSSNGGDLEQHREKALTFVCASGLEVLVVAPDLPTKQRWVDGCDTLGLLERVAQAPGAVSAAAGQLDLQAVEDSLPAGWETARLQSTGDLYYQNLLTGESTFDRPTAPADALQTELQAVTPAAPAPAAAPADPVPVAGKKPAAMEKATKKEAKRLAKQQAKAAKKEKDAAKKNPKTSAAPASAEVEAEVDLAEYAVGLPSGWEPTLSRSTGLVYYINTVTNDTTYDRPTERAFTDSFLSSAGPEIPDCACFFPHALDHRCSLRFCPSVVWVVWLWC